MKWGTKSQVIVSIWREFWISFSVASKHIWVMEKIVKSNDAQKYCDCFDLTRFSMIVTCHIGPRISSYIPLRFRIRKAIHIQCPKYIGVKIVPKYAFCCTKRWYWNFHQGISHSDAVIFLYWFWMNRWIDIKKKI